MGPDSDLDVLVIMPDGVHSRDTSTLVYRSLRRFGYAIDVVVATEGDLASYNKCLSRQGWIGPTFSTSRKTFTVPAQAQGRGSVGGDQLQQFFQNSGLALAFG